MPDTISIAEAARRAGKGERAIRYWLQKGQVEAVRDESGVRRVVVSTLEAHLATLGRPPASVPANVPGLAELAAELTATRKALSDAQWQVGYLTAKLEAAQRPPLLEAGPDIAAVPESVPGLSLRARIAAWWRDA